MPSPKRLTPRSAVALLLAFALAGGPVAASAATTAQITAKRARAAQVESAMQKTRADLSVQMGALDKMSGDLVTTRQQIDAGSRRLAALQKRLSAAQGQLDARAAFTYRSGGTEFLDMLFGTMSFSDFVDRLDILTRIAERDAQLVSDVKDARVEATQLQTTLRTHEAQLVVLRNRADAKRAIVQRSLDAQQTTLHGLTADVAALVLAQERAQAMARAAAHGSGGGSGSGGGNPGHAGGGGISAATVDGLSGTFWVTSGEPTHYHTTGVDVSGQASWYSVGDSGTGTASGRPLNDTDLTCAHPSLAFGTRIAVSYGGHHCIVVVTDRGPYTGGRVLDVSKRAHDILGFDGVGYLNAQVVAP